MSELFFDHYAPAREAFRAAATAAGFRLRTLDHGTTGPGGEPLGIEVAVKGSAAPRRALVISSGTHGVEGYFGTAVQLDALRGELGRRFLAEDEAIVLLHAVNPWGFAHKRRVDHEGIDLNRNFRKPGDTWSGAPAGYRRLEGLLNPASPPGGFDPWLLSAAAQLVRYGFADLKDAVAQGQYDFPHGLFFGGRGPSRSYSLLQEALPPLLGGAHRVLHLDLHTGSGKWGTYVHCADLPADSDRVTQLRQDLGEDKIQAFDKGGVLYQINGALGPWLEAIMPGPRYDTMLTEFGTYPNLRVLAGMRYENRIARFAGEDRELRAKGAAELMELFCPADPQWRRSCVEQAQDAVLRAAKAVLPGD
jgi:predicted deacylase